MKEEEKTAKRLSPSLGVRWTHLNPKFGSNVETGDPTHAPRACGKVYCSHNEALLGEKCRLPSMSGNGLRANRCRFHCGYRWSWEILT